MAGSGLEVVYTPPPADSGLEVVHTPEPEAPKPRVLTGDPALDAMIHDANEAARGGRETTEHGLRVFAGIDPAETRAPDAMLQPGISALEGILTAGSGLMSWLGSPLAPLFTQTVEANQRGIAEPLTQATGSEFLGQSAANLLTGVEGMALAPEMVVRPKPIRHLPIEPTGVARETARPAGAKVEPPPLDLAEMRATIPETAQAARAPETEKISAPAVRHQGKVATGANHAEAMDALFGENWPSDRFMTVDEGFTTNKGRFVSRSEAAGLYDFRGNKPSTEHLEGPEFAHLKNLKSQVVDEAAQAARAAEPAASDVLTQEPDRPGGAPPREPPPPGDGTGGTTRPPPGPRSIFDELHDSASSVGARINAKLDPLRIKLQDKMLRLERVEEAAERARASALPDEQRAYRAEELYHGITGEKLERFRVDTVDPLVEAIANSGAELADLNRYLYARHAVERNAQIARINEAMSDGGSGMTNAEAATVLQSFDPTHTAVLEGLARRVDAITRETADILVEGGLLEPEARAAWDATYQHYVPLRGFEIDLNPFSPDAAERARIGKGLDIRGQESKRAMGRESRAGDIVSHTVLAREEAVVRAEKNRVGQTFLRFVNENPDPRLWEVNTVPVERRVGASGLVEPYRDTRYQLADNVFAVKVGGEQHFITIKDPALARAMKNLGAESMNGFWGVMASANRILSKLATQWNPTFIIPNFARDLQTALVNLKQFDDAKIAGISKQVIINVPYAARAVWDMSRGRRGEPGAAAPRQYWQFMAREFAEHGGKINFFGLDDLSTISTRIKRQIESLRPGRLNDAKKMFADFGQLITDVNTSIENATRLATYEALRRNDVPAPRAASIARNLTVNFNRKGEWGPYLNSAYLFFNAGLQGSATLAKTLVKSPTARGIAGGGVLLGFLLDQINNVTSAPEADGVSQWDKATAWEKDHNFIVMLPDGSSIKIPAAYGLNVFPTIGRRVSELMRSAPNSSVLGATTGILTATVDAFNPLGGGADMFSSTEGAVRGATPSIVRPVVEYALNLDYAGRPIQRPKREFGKLLPEAQRGFGREGPVASWITNALSEATGGTRHQPGGVDVSPAMLDHMFEGYTSGLGRLVTQSLKLPFSSPEDLGQARNWPIVNRFIGSKNQWYTNARFYAVRDAVEAVEADWRDYMRKGDRKGIASLRENNAPEFAVMQTFNGAQRTLNGLYRQRKLLNDMALTPEKKQERIDALEENIRSIQMRAIKAYQRALETRAP